mgnify:CR=1 FL=1
MAKTGSAVVAMSSGHTRNAMQTNLVRVAMLPLAWFAVLQGAGLSAVIAVAIFAELLGYGLSFILIARKPGVALRPMLWPVLFFMGFMAVAGGYPFATYFALWSEAIVLCVLLVVAALSMKEMFRYMTGRRGEG